jgi:hypothetical protein
MWQCRRNGSSKKTVLTETAKIDVRIPRDREGTFDPKLIQRYQRRFPGFDDKIVSMYGAKRHGGARLKDDICASPRLTVSQPPAMSTADRVLCEQNVARTDKEVLTLARLEVERSTQRNDHCLMGASCQANAPPEAVSSNEIVVAILPLSMSPRAPGSRSMTPSSKCEFRSSPVHIRTHRIMALLLFSQPPVLCPTLDRRRLSPARSAEMERRLLGQGWRARAAMVARRAASKHGRRLYPR